MTTIRTDIQTIREEHQVLEGLLAIARERVAELEGQQERLQLGCPHPGVVHSKEGERFLTCPDCGKCVLNSGQGFDLFFTTM